MANQRINIEIDYWKGEHSSYSWLKQYLTNSLSAVGLEAVVNINTAPFKNVYNIEVPSNSNLYLMTKKAISKSAIKKIADENNQWYVHLLIAPLHASGYAGVMYDFKFDSRAREGCAIFEEEIKKHSENDTELQKRMIARTAIHEIGHCLNLVHRNEPDITVMAQTSNLMNSKTPPGWHKNINYLFHKNDIAFIKDFPDKAKPGGGSDSNSGQSSNDVVSKAPSRSLIISLLNFNLEEKLEFKGGDMISAVLKVENNSKRTIKLALPIDLNSENLKLCITSPTRDVRLYESPILACGHSNQVAEIKPGENRFISINLLSDKTGYIFNFHGAYNLKFSLKKAGKSNIWYSSGFISVNVLPPLQNELEIFKKKFTPKLLQYITIGGGNNPYLIRKCKRLMQNEKLKDAGYILPIAWCLAHTIKNKILHASNKKLKENYIKELTQTYQVILESDYSEIRKGKIVNDYLKIPEDYKPEPILIDINSRDAYLKVYREFEKDLIKRMNYHNKKTSYEKQLSKS